MLEQINEQNEATTTTLCVLNKKEMCLSETDLSEIKNNIFTAISSSYSRDKSLKQLTADTAGSSLSLRQSLLAEMNHWF